MVSKHRSSHSLKYDPKEFEQELATLGLTEGQQRELLEAVFQIAVNFVDLAMGIHPAQQACGQNTKNPTDSTIREKNHLYYSSSIITDEAMSTSSESEKA